MNRNQYWLMEIKLLSLIRTYWPARINTGKSQIKLMSKWMVIQTVWWRPQALNAHCLWVLMMSHMRTYWPVRISTDQSPLNGQQKKMNGNPNNVWKRPQAWNAPVPSSFSLSHGTWTIADRTGALSSAQLDIQIKVQCIMNTIYCTVYTHYWPP